MKLQKALDISADILISALTEYVRQNGQDYHKDGAYIDSDGEERNTWEDNMDIFADEGERITKILDFYNWVGCQITTQQVCNPDKEDSLNDAFTTQAVYALYIVEHNGEERLWYYSFYNPGVEYRDEESEPEHAPVDSLGVDELVLMAATIIHCENND